MITVLVISACLSGTPEVCKDFRTPMDERVTVSQCFMAAPQSIAIWNRGYPNWQFKRLTCQEEENHQANREQEM